MNLQRGAEQVRLLRGQRVPAVLEPVKAYLLASLERSLEMERARYAYYKSDDLAPMGRILCSACHCDAADRELLRQLRTEADPGKRHLLSWHDWNNRVAQCDRAKRRPARYPIEAWQRFIKQYGITEQGIGVPVD